MKYITILFLIILLSCKQEIKTPQESIQKPSEVVYIEINKKGIINTFVDGTELGKVNIWASNKNKNQIITVCKKNEEVTVLVSDEYYFKVRTSEGKEGWLMKGFVRLVDTH